MKKLLCVLLCLTQVLAMVAAAGGGEEAENEKIELSFWHLSYSEKQFNTIVPEFMDMYPNIEVPMTYNPN